MSTLILKNPRKPLSSNHLDSPRLTQHLQYSKKSSQICILSHCALGLTVLRSEYDYTDSTQIATIFTLLLTRAQHTRMGSLRPVETFTQRSACAPPQIS